MATRAKPHIFKPARRRIYCGDTTQSRLEHIIPKSLIGALLLPEASCQKCEDVTKKFEQTCARSMFGPLRTSYDFPTRRRKERPKGFLVDFNDGSDQSHEVWIEAQRYPKILFLLQFCYYPELILADDQNAQFDIKPFVITTEPTDLTPFVGMSLGKFDAFAFARLIAKIGHGLAAATVRRDEFEPMAVDFILGKTNSLTTFVGGLSKLEPPTTSLHWIRLRDHICLKTRRRFLVAYVRLFAALGAPTYLVVVGRRAWEAPLLEFQTSDNR